MSSSTSSSEAKPFDRPLYCWVASFLVTSALLLGASEWLLRTQVVPQDMLTRHAAFFEATHASKAAFGDSHVARGFLPTGQIANFAYPSESFDQMEWKIDRYLTRTEHPDTVLLQADPHFFAEYRLGMGLQEYPEFFGGPMRWQPYVLTEYYRPQLGAIWRRFILTGGELRQSVEFTSRGGLRSPGNLSRWSKPLIDRFLATRLAIQQPLEDRRSIDARERYRGVVANLRAAGAQVCLVSFPISPIYAAAISELPPERKRSWDDVNLFFRELGKEVGVRYLDDRGIYTDLSLFRDPDHLNGEGARLYTQRLESECFARDNK